MNETVEVSLKDLHYLEGMITMMQTGYTRLIQSHEEFNTPEYQYVDVHTLENCGNFALEVIKDLRK